MATLLFELVRALSGAAAGELRARSDGPALSRAELVALATLSDLAAACCEAHPAPRVDDIHDLASLERLAAFDLKIVDNVRARASAGAAP